MIEEIEKVEIIVKPNQQTSINSMLIQTTLYSNRNRKFDYTTKDNNAKSLLLLLLR